MKIKNLFDDLKQLGKKKYYFKNGEEEIYFSRKDLEIEIVNINNNIDLIITHNGLRNNYINSNQHLYLLTQIPHYLFLKPHNRVCIFAGNLSAKNTFYEQLLHLLLGGLEPNTVIML